MINSKFTVAVVCLLASKGVYAGCDSCLQSSIQSASASINNSLNSLQTTVNANVTAAETLNSTISASSSTLVGLLETQNSQLVTSIDAATNKLLLSNDKLNKTIINLTDFMTSEITSAMKSELNIQGYKRNLELLGPLSQPITGDISANRAPLLQAGILDFKNRLENEMALFRQWALMRGESDNNSKQRIKVVNEKIETLTPQIDKLTQNVITEGEVSDLLTLFKLMVMPSPRPAESLSGEDQIEYYRQVEKNSMAFMVLARDVLLRAPLIETDSWKIGYTKVDDIEGKTSLIEFMLSETQRKYYSSEWHLDIKTKTNTGLLREQVYQTNMENFLLNELVSEERRTLGMLSLK